jgi:septal ring factor EnvC (AmiA/AmiB activator)
MNSGLIGSVVTGIATLLVAYYTYRQTRKSKDAQETVDKIRADGEAYARAMTINAQIVSDLQEELSRVQTALTDVRRQLALEQNHSAEFERRVAVLQRSVNRMTELLTEHEIPIPEDA